MQEKNTKVKISYETLWKFIIRPPRDIYPISYLGHPYFSYKERNYIRKDYELISSQGYKMKCSLIEPEPLYRPSKEMPIVVYLHGNASCRLEGLRTLSILLPYNIHLFLVDLPGCGLSEGEYISLGYYESYDVGIIIDFLENLPGVGNIGLWGRSMGAATTLIYAHRDKRIKAICMDSPFANFCRLARELTSRHINLPEFLINGALTIIRMTILSKNGMDIYKLNPIEEAEKTFQPAIFVHAINDQLIDKQHSMDIFNIYGGEKSLKLSETGGHNSKRPKRIVKDIGKFFAENLCNYKNEFDNIILNENNSDENDEEALNMGEYFRNEEYNENNIKNINNSNNIKHINSRNNIKNKVNLDIDKSYDFKLGKISEDKYIIQKEEEEKKNLDEFKNFLKKISQNEIQKDNSELNSTNKDDNNTENK